jgi:hypothetical protein
MSLARIEQGQASEGRNIARGRKSAGIRIANPGVKFHAVSAFFTPSSSLQLTGKPFDNMSNTGE